jgi:hypothetical protein
MIIITAPFCSLTHFAPYHYTSGLSKYWFVKHLSELGFSPVEATPNDGWLDFVAQEVWRLPCDVVRLLDKLPRNTSSSFLSPKKHARSSNNARTWEKAAKMLRRTVISFSRQGRLVIHLQGWRIAK